jgi:hypothetical protein
MALGGGSQHLFTSKIPNVECLCYRAHVIAVPPLQSHKVINALVTLHLMSRDIFGGGELIDFCELGQNEEKA